MKKNPTKKIALSLLCLVALASCMDGRMAETIHQMTFATEKSVIVTPDGGEAVIVSSERSEQKVGPTDWKSQLDGVMSGSSELMRASNIKLVGYEIVGDIDSNAKLLEYKKEVKNDENMIPLYAGNFKSVRAVKKQEIESLSPMTDAQYSFSKKDEYIEQTVSKGMKVLRLNWNNNGVKTSTLCVVSDTGGVVYDNFITNTFDVEVDSGTTVVVENKPAEAMSTRSGGGPSFYGSVTWTFAVEAYWLWGSDRGRAEVTHTGYYADCAYTRHDFDATYWYALGTARAEVREIGNDTIAYVVALATPMVNISITWSGSAYNLVFGTEFGSSVGDTGQHTCPPRYEM